MARRCFYSFHYKPDSWRAATVRNIGSIEGNTPVSDNDWETITGGGDAAIERWIDSQLKGRSHTVVLVGTNTAKRKWVKHEIVQSWNEKMGVVGIHIHGLKDSGGDVSPIGANPFDFVTHGDSGNPLSSIAKCYNPAGRSSQDRYDWISKHLENAVEEAINIRSNN